jgi:DNA helicase-2/ATP-dependent DNA helicase PcrA
VRLVRDYRSTPQVVGLANQVIRLARGDEARLRLELVGQRQAGPEPVLRGYADEPAEAAGVAARCAELVAGGTPPREIAILFRTNAQSEAYEEALAEAGVPYVVQGAERFFERTEVRQAMAALRAAVRTVGEGVGLRAAATEALVAVGWRPDAPPSGGAARERWEALAALVRLAEDFGEAREPSGRQSGDTRTLAEFNEELTRRAQMQHAPTVDGVTIASLHSAKGLEWDAVFLVGLVEGVLPTVYAKTPEAIEEERRLLYVGITRARVFLTLSYASARSPGGRARRPSRFLPVESSAPAGRTRTRDPDGTRRRLIAVPCRVCGASLSDPAARKLGRCLTCPSTMDEELFGRLKQWRIGMASAQHVPAYVVFTDATLTAIAERRPSSVAQLVDIAGIGPRKLGLYGEAVIALVSGARPQDLLGAESPAEETSATSS